MEVDSSVSIYSKPGPSNWRIFTNSLTRPRAANRRGNGAFRGTGVIREAWLKPWEQGRHYFIGTHVQGSEVPTKGQSCSLRLCLSSSLESQQSGALVGCRWCSWTLQALMLCGSVRLSQSKCGTWVFPSDISLAWRTLLAPLELAVLLGHLEELRDARCLRFWEIDRCRFLMEELAAMVTTQGWWMACSAVRRAGGSNTSRCWMKSLARLDTEDQGWKSTQTVIGVITKVHTPQDVNSDATHKRITPPKSSSWVSGAGFCTYIDAFKAASKLDARFPSNKEIKLWSLCSADLTSRTKLKGKLNVTEQTEAAVLAEWIWSLGGRTALPRARDLDAYLFLAGISSTIKAAWMSLAGVFGSLLSRIADQSPRRDPSWHSRNLFCHLCSDVAETTTDVWTQHNNLHHCLCDGKWMPTAIPSQPNPSLGDA